MAVEGPIHLSPNKSKVMRNGLRKKEKTGQTNFFFILCVIGGMLLCNTSAHSAALILFGKGRSETLKHVPQNRHKVSIRGLSYVPSFH